MSECWASLETGNSEVDPFYNLGKVDDRSGSERHGYRSVSAGVLALARGQDKRSGNTVSPDNGMARANR